MADVLTTYEPNVAGPDGSVWSARACARPIEGHWEGWIEFMPLAADEIPLRTPQETTQPDRAAVAYWASGLTHAYLEGALDRARIRPARIVTEDPSSLFDGPAPSIVTVPGPMSARPLLDPHEVYAQGEEILVAQLGALGIEHLRNIALAHELAPPDTLAAETHAELSARIITAARERTAAAPR